MVKVFTLPIGLVGKDKGLKISKTKGGD